MKNIVTIFTGGTIGSKKNSSGEISPAKDMSYRLLEMYQETWKQNCMETLLEKSESEILFVSEEPYYILSENLTGTELLVLAGCVNRYLPEEERKYVFPLSFEKNIDVGEKNQQTEGIVIMHGTDTLAYTAAFLGLLFEDVSIPILLVSSAYPLEDVRANGLRNFRGAVEFIKGGYGAGVFVSYANEGENVTIHRGTRLIRSLEYSADVISAENRFYGRFQADGVFLKNPNYMEEREDFYEGFLKRGSRNFQKAVNGNIEIHFSKDCPEILRIVPYPGMSYPKISEEMKVVLMESYHSGTIGITDGLRRFMKEAKKRGLPVYLTGLNREDADYETVGQYEEMGIIPLRNKTAVTQYMKFWLMLKNDCFFIRKPCETVLALL